MLKNPVIENQYLEVGTKEINSLPAIRTLRPDTNYAEKILLSMNNQRSNSEYCDILIKVNDVEFPCHKTILAGASTQLKKMLDFLEVGEILAIHAIDAEVVGSILNFIYTGSINISISNAKDIFLAGKFFKMTAVQKAAVEILESSIDLSNCIQLYIFAQRYNCVDLERKAFLFAIKHFDNLWSSKDILDLSQQQLINFLAADDLRIGLEEHLIFLTAQRWYNEHPKKEADLLSIMEKVRFHKMDLNFLRTCFELFPILKLSPKVSTLIASAKLANVKNNAQSEELLPCKYLHVSDLDAVEVILMVGQCYFKQKDTCSSVHFYCYVLETEEAYFLPFKPPIVPLISMICMKDQIYIFDGEILWKSDKTNKILQKAASGVQIQDVGEIVALGNRIYLMDEFNSVYQCEFETKKWVEVGKLNTEVNYSTVVACNESLYIAGGIIRRTKATCKFLQKYCATTNRCSFMADMPFAREDAASCFLNGFIYIIGGDNHPNRCLNEVARYNIKMNCWEIVASMLKGRRSPSAIVKDGRIYVVGGHNRKDKLVREMECYDHITNKWEIVANVPDCIISSTSLNLKGATLKIPRSHLYDRVM